MNVRIYIFAAMMAAATALTACTAERNQTADVPVVEAPTPKPINGWIEFPLADGVFKSQPSVWRTDVIEIPVPAKGGELEYKLAMKKGDALIYSIDYGALDHPGVMVSEFHGHTEKRADGIGDLMFYSRTGGALQHGQMIAPWEGVHGWYLKNDSPDVAVVTLKLAGFYELVGL